jgi:hypothetical protein
VFVVLLGSQVTSNVPGFKGSLQQLTFNGEDIFELARSGQLTNHQVHGVLNALANPPPSIEI